MTCCTLAPEPPEPMSHAEQEARIVLSYVEQRDDAVLRAEELEVKNRELQQENAALRRASEASAAHRKALEKLVSEYKSLVNQDIYEIISCHEGMSEDEFTDEFHARRAKMNHRATELLTTQE